MMMQYLDEAVSNCEALVTQSDPAELAATAEWLMACQTVGNILSGMGFAEDAYSWQTMGLDITPNPAKFFFVSGRAYSRCQVWDRAAYFCKRTLEYTPDDAEAYCRLAKVYNKLGDYKSESETIHALLAQRPDKTDAEGHYQLGKIMETHDLSEQAAECYQQVIERDPEFSLAYYALSELWVKQGNPQGSIELLQQLAERLNDDATAHYRLGRAYRQAGQHETAILSFRQALNLDSELHWAYMGLLNSLLQLQRWDEAIESCRGIIHFVGEFPWAYCFLGNALAQKGEDLEAAKSHQKAFELRGWERCLTNDYRFTHTWFSENMVLWEKYLLPLNDAAANGSVSQGAASRAPINILSLGSSDGSSLCWLVDEILRQPSDRLVCMAEGVSQQLQKNFAKLPESDKVSVKTGRLPVLLESLPGTEFDMIYIQSERKQSIYLNALAKQAWPQLKPNGLMFFKDYQWSDPSDPAQASRLGIDEFIQSVQSEGRARVSVLHQSHQLILRKEGKQDA